MMGENGISKEGENFYTGYTWENAHHNISCLTEKYFDVWNRNGFNPVAVSTFQNWRAGLANLSAILAEAEQGGKSVRAVGSGYSLSAVAVSKQYMLNTAPLDIAFIGLPSNYFASHVENEKFALAQCGVAVSQLNRWLADKGLALPTCGSSDGQTIAGAMSTGTHGAAIDVGSIQDYVMGIHLLTGSNKSYWVEGRHTVLSDEALAAFCPQGVIRVNDDVIFNAALVCFGSFGIIAAVLIKAEPLYQLKLFQKYFPLKAVRPCIGNPRNLASLGLPSEDIHHVEFVINPYKKEQLVTRIMYKIKQPQLEFVTAVSHGIGIDIIEVFGSFADKHPWWVGRLMVLINKLFTAQYQEVAGGIDYPGNIFKGNNSGFRGKGMSMEIGVDVSNAERTLDIIYQTAAEKPLPGVLGVRYIKKSKALLSMASFDTTSTFEIPAAFSTTTEAYYLHLWETLDKNNIPYTFHWGQMTNLDASKVISKWGAKTVGQWITSRNFFLPTQDQKNRFSNDLLVRCGLNI